MKKDSIWVNLGLSIKLPMEDIPKLKKFIREQGYYIVFDDWTPYRIEIRKVPVPSGTGDTSDSK